MYTFPIMVCVEGPLDFVKDCTAVLFISQLDDLDDPKDLKELIIKVKFRLMRGQSRSVRGQGYFDVDLHNNDDLMLNNSETAFLKDKDNKNNFSKQNDFGREDLK